MTISIIKNFSNIILKIIMRSILIIILFSGVGLGINGCCGTKSLNCNDGNSVVIQQCPHKFYQQYAKSTDFLFKATIDVLEKVKIADINIGTTTEIINFRQQLDQYSSRTQDLLKANIFAYNSTPCDLEVRKNYMSLLKLINEESSALEKLKIGLEILNSQTSVNDKELFELINEYSTNSGFRTCNINLTDNFSFYFVTKDSTKALINPFLLPYSDVQRSNVIDNLLVGFLNYIPVDKTSYLNDVKIYRIIDEKVIDRSADKSEIIKGCNNGIIIIPKKVIDSFKDEHLAFTYIKSLIC